ncbi:MAG: glutamate racemase [bacterium]|nr:glutamate racemase [bacterium]MDZ4341441.1 glutamate racemase [Candidatus Binatia bacterium]
MSDSDKKPNSDAAGWIGLFDSGYGGLTIFKEISHQLPQYSYIYFGDNARAPYGSRQPEEIYQHTITGVEYLFSQGAQLVILACNTASAVALRRLQQEWLPRLHPDKKVLGIIVPTIEQITGVSWRNSENWKLKIENSPAQTSALVLGVLATPQTVASKAYEHEIHKRNSNIKVYQQACPGLVKAIEDNSSQQNINKILQNCITSLRGQLFPKKSGAAISTSEKISLLLGCTHYELVADQIHSLLPESVTLYEQPKIVAAKLADYLNRHSAIATSLDKTGQRRFVTSGDPQKVSAQAAKFWGEPIQFTKA